MPVHIQLRDPSTDPRMQELDDLVMAGGWSDGRAGRRVNFQREEISERAERMRAKYGEINKRYRNVGKWRVSGKEGAL